MLPALGGAAVPGPGPCAALPLGRSAVPECRAGLSWAGREGGEGWGGGSPSRASEGLLPFPSGSTSCWCLAAAASRYLLQLATPSSSPKTASKTTISFLLRDGGKHMHTHSPVTGSLLSRTGCLRQRHRAGAGPGGRLRNPLCPLSPAQSRLAPLTGLAASSAAPEKAGRRACLSC